MSYRLLSVRVYQTWGIFLICWEALSLFPATDLQASGDSVSRLPPQATSNSEHLKNALITRRGHIEDEPDNESWDDNEPSSPRIHKSEGASPSPHINEKNPMFLKGITGFQKGTLKKGGNALAEPSLEVIDLDAPQRGGAPVNSANKATIHPGRTVPAQPLANFLGGIKSFDRNNLNKIAQPSPPAPPTQKPPLLPPTLPMISHGIEKNLSIPALPHQVNSPLTKPQELEPNGQSETALNSNKLSSTKKPRDQSKNYMKDIKNGTGTAALTETHWDKDLEARAKAGDPDALAELGRYHINRGNFKLGNECIEKAYIVFGTRSKQGDLNARHQLALWKLEGATKENEGKQTGIKILETAAKAGHQGAANSLLLHTPHNESAGGHPGAELKSPSHAHSGSTGGHSFAGGRNDSFRKRVTNQLAQPSPHHGNNHTVHHQNQ